MLRHERQTVRMELAAALHHSWGGGLETNEGLRAQKTASAGPAEYFDLSSDDGRPAGGERPAALLEPRPQERDRRHTGVGYEIAQNLEVPVPQMGEQLPDVLQFFASFLPGVAEQVIEVPKIFLDTTPQRLGDHLRQPQMVEQLVHVSTVVSYSSLQQRTAVQIVDFPVPGRAGGWGRGGLQGFPAGQNSAALHVEQPVDIPVPQGRGGVGARGGLQGFAGQSSTASSSRVGAADGAGQGVFRTFPQIKKSAKQGPHSGSERVDTPVPLGLREESGGLQSFLPVQDSTAFCGADYVEQIVDIPVCGGLQGFLPGQASSSSRSRLVDEAEEWGFLRTFPTGKKCGVPGRWVRSWVGTSAHPR